MACTSSLTRSLMWAEVCFKILDLKIWLAARAWKNMFLLDFMLQYWYATQLSTLTVTPLHNDKELFIAGITARRIK